MAVYRDTQPSTVDYMKISSSEYNRVMWIIPEVYFIQRILYGIYFVNYFLVQASSSVPECDA